VPAGGSTNSGLPSLGAANYQECRRVLGAVSKNTKDRKQPRLSLGLGDDHQSFEALQNGLGIFHEGRRQRVFKVEIVEVVRWEYLASKSGFPALPGPKECDHCQRFSPSALWRVC
jgi:hypothetical protein